MNFWEISKIFSFRTNFNLNPKMGVVETHVTETHVAISFPRISRHVHPPLNWLFTFLDENTGFGIGLMAQKKYSQPADRYKVASDYKIQHQQLERKHSINWL